MLNKPLRGYLDVHAVQYGRSRFLLNGGTIIVKYWAPNDRKLWSSALVLFSTYMPGILLLIRGSVKTINIEIVSLEAPTLYRA